MGGLTLKAMTADALDEDTVLLSPCHHPETHASIIQGSIVLHCRDSVLNGGECEKLIAFRMRAQAAIAFIQSAGMSPGEEYIIRIKCAKCNEGHTDMEMLQDLEVLLNVGIDAMQLTCQSCGELFGLVPIARREEIN